MTKLNIHFISGINGDKVKVTINDSIVKEYIYGYNASYNRKYAKYAEQDVENAKRYHWIGSYCLKPFIGDILDELIKEYQPNEIEYSGYNVFSGRKMTEEEIQKTIKAIEKER
jgi:hypothetical protein